MQGTKAYLYEVDIQSTCTELRRVIKIEENNEDELEIEHKGNLITLEDGTEVIFIPTTGICYSHTMRPEKLGILSEDNKRIIKDY